MHSWLKRSAILKLVFVDLSRGLYSKQRLKRALSNEISKPKKKTIYGHPVLSYKEFRYVMYIIDRLCGLVVSVEDYKHRGPGFDSRALLRIFLRALAWNGSTQPRDRIN
jgi:hypothetical protein